MKDCALIIFVKNPVLGKVKTRLAKTIGDEAALAAYLHLLEVTKSIVLKSTSQKFIFYSDHIDQEDLWQEELGFEKKVQEGNDLGERMAHAFNHVLEEYPKAVIIGSDCGDLTSDIIDKAFSALEETSVVIGPSLDGGYYLLGMNQYYPQLFTDIEWSTDQVFRTTLHRTLSEGIPVTELIELSDIDNESDWKRYQARCQS